MSPSSTDEFSQKMISARLARADDLGVFPPAAVRILRVVDDPRTNLVDLEKAVSLDPVLTAQVLKVANSAYFGLARTVGSLRQALFVLGFRTVRSMALSLAAMTMGASEGPWRRRVWRRSIRTCHAMRHLGTHVDWDDYSEPFAVGLLHKIGMLLLLKLEDKTYTDMLEHMRWGSPELLEKESHFFGFDHIALGGACLERWNLPEEVCLAVRHQENPDALAGQEDPQLLAQLLWIATRMERRLATQEGAEAIAQTLAATPVAQKMGLSVAALVSTAVAVRKEDDDLFSL
jgi:HD-like signal output (HDOD) protein